MAEHGPGSHSAIDGRHGDVPAEEEEDTRLMSEHTQDEPAPKADRLDESSPLLDSRKPDDDEEGLLNEDPYDLADSDGQEQTKSVWYLFMLTLSIGGLQIAWATELSNGSPFLLSLGLSKALLAFVWIAGPLMGVLVQPYIGILSDRSQSSWGRRRPFMLGGALGTIISLIALAWTRQIVGGILSLFGADPESKGVKVTSIVHAVIWVYILDFAINAVQAAIRAYIVDNAPTHQQEDANAWASRLTGFGNILGYLSGYVNLPKIFPFLGDTQFKVLCVFSAVALGSTVVISCLYIKEKDPRQERPPPSSRLGLLAFFNQTFVALVKLPPQIRKICQVQFFNWIGWFPFLFYITTYIGQLAVNPIFEEHPDLPPEEVDRHWENATRIGSFALLIYAITSFIASIVLPILVIPSYQPIAGDSNTDLANSKFFRLLANFRIPHLTLRRAWMYSHVLFALCMLSTFFISSPVGGTIMTGFIGIAWSLTMWAPFALIAAEISKREALKRSRKAERSRRRRMGTGEDDAFEEGGHDQAGVVLGLHNVAVSAPQILATLISSGIFKLSQKDRGVAGDDSVGWVLRFGGLAAIIAAGMTWRLGEERDNDIAREREE